MIFQARSLLRATGELSIIVTGQHTQGSAVPGKPVSTSAVKTLEEDVPAIPCPGIELYKFQNLSTLLYKLRLTKITWVGSEHGGSCCMSGRFDTQRWHDLPAEDPSSPATLKVLLSLLLLSSALFPFLAPSLAIQRDSFACRGPSAWSPLGHTCSSSKAQPEPSLYFH